MGINKNQYNYVIGKAIPEAKGKKMLELRPSCS